MLDVAPSLYSSKYTPSFSLIAFGVIVFHFLLLGIGNHWKPAQPAKPKPLSRVIVQTVKLSPHSHTVQSTKRSPPPILEAPTSVALSPSSVKTEEAKFSAPVKQEEMIIAKTEVPAQKEEIKPIKEIAPIEPTSPPIPAPAKMETKGQTQPKPKPVPQTPPKVEAKKTTPVKQTTEQTKKTDEIKKEEVKKREEAEKKKQQEKAEVERKKQQEKGEAEKKQKEKAEAEKRRQQEIAEAEKKKQQEIAVAHEAAKQKMAKAKETLAKMGETRDKLTASPSVNLETTALPKELASLHVDALPFSDEGGASTWGTKEASYSDEVAYRLKMNLKLPDYGAVKIRLTIDRAGKVLKVETLKSESNKNKTYVESKVPTLLFPSFGQKFQGVPQNTFVITLQNDS